MKVLQSYLEVFYCFFSRIPSLVTCCVSYRQCGLQQNHPPAKVGGVSVWWDWCSYCFSLVIPTAPHTLLLLFWVCCSEYSVFHIFTINQNFVWRKGNTVFLELNLCKSCVSLCVQMKIKLYIQLQKNQEWIVVAVLSFVFHCAFFFFLFF